MHQNQTQHFFQGVLGIFYYVYVCHETLKPVENQQHQFFRENGISHVFEVISFHPSKCLEHLLRI